MKTKILLICFSFLLLSMQCDDENHSGITPEMLDNKKQEILDYINSFSCAEASGCNTIAFGAKPCGGPRKYLAYPKELEAELLPKITKYNNESADYNRKRGLTSDCEVVPIPSGVKCEDGKAILLYNNTTQETTN